MNMLREYIRALLESGGSFIPAIAGWFDRQDRSAFVKEFPEGCVVQITTGSVLSTRMHEVKVGSYGVARSRG